MRLVPDDALVIEKVDGEWPEDVLTILANIGSASRIGQILDALTPGGDFVEVEPEFDHEGVMELAEFGRQQPHYHVGQPLRRYVTRWERYD